MYIKVATLMLSMIKNNIQTSMCESRSNPRLRAWLSNNKHNIYSRGDQKVLGSYLKHYNQNPKFPILPMQIFVGQN